MPTDIEIAQSIELKPIEEIAKKAGFLKSEVENHGHFKAKINLSAMKRVKDHPDGKLILVTTTTPTSKGEGKTTTTIGLADAIRKLKKKAFICIRQPSLGPVMGLKGGAAGGGKAQVLPMEDINLHFTGDMHVITAAHNLLTAMVYNHIYQGNELAIDENRIVWKRVMDMNDRALRPGFDITASSEVMAVMCLSTSLMDMKKRLSRIIVAYDKYGRVISAKEIKAHGAMTLVMRDALKPNIAQTIEGTPAFIHGGPFANIAHGCNSIVATQLALKMANFVVTEAGFATDLGAEKFFDIKCRKGKLNPAAVVLVVTTQAIEQHGLENLGKHIENIQCFGVPLVVAINKKLKDNMDKILEIKEYCTNLKIACEISEVWEKGGEGGINLAKKVMQLTNQPTDFRFLYKLEDSLEQKILKVATRIYGADGVVYTDEAKKDIKNLERLGLSKLPICIAKTQYSLSDDPKLIGRPKGFKITVRELHASAGAGFIIVLTGKIVTMPGLPKHPAAENMDIDEEGKIVGLF